MKVKDLDRVVVGLRIKGLKTGKIGTVVCIDKNDDDYAWIVWEDGDCGSGFYGNDSNAEVVEGLAENVEELKKILYNYKK